jgi:hypothetical protein
MKICESHSIHREKNLCGGAVSPVAASPVKDLPPASAMVCAMALAALVLGLGGCGDTAKLPTAASSGQVQTYYYGNQVTIDHYGKQVSVAGDSDNPGIEGTFTTTASGITNISETFSANGDVTFNPPLTGAWLVEMTGVGATGNLLSTDGGKIFTGDAVVMAGNTECPSFSKATRFLFVNVPVKQLNPSDARDPHYYGTTDINTQGSSVDFNTSYYTLGQPVTNPTTYQGDAACATSGLGSLISYPVNQFAGGSGGYSALAKSQFLVGDIPAPAWNNSQYVVQNVVGLAMPSSAVTTTALSSTHFIGLLHEPSATPQDGVSAGYDPGVLGGAFGDEAGSSSACSSFQAGITASVANKTLSQAPSAQAIYGGDFPKTSANPTAAPGDSGTETCDMAIDLGTQDATNNGLFPGAQLYTGTSTAVTSTSGTAIVSQIDGRSVLLFRTYSTSSTGRLLVLFQALQ